MTKLQFRKTHDNAIVPIIGKSDFFHITALDARLDVRLRDGAANEQPKAYWVNTGLQFIVPDGYALTIYPDPALAKIHHARLAGGIELIEPGDSPELVLRMIVDDGGKLFEPKPGMVIARAALVKTTEVILEEIIEEHESTEEAAPAERKKERAAASTSEKAKK